jgi:serine/threonine protein kinase/tetratricopeptide (TPR) repeat protein
VRPGDVIADQFELVRVAGVGGMGEVWLAQDQLQGVPVALKLLTGTTESGKARFLREAAVLAELRHPGIVRYVSHGLTPSQELYLVMEWLEGEDLAKRLERGPLSVESTAALLRNAAEALGIAHARGIVHRDIKPSNIFLPEGSIQGMKILDFGVARVGVTTRTRVGAMVGTPGYMAPEQARGEEEVDARADVFALGCVAFECLTGRRAFEADHVMALLAKILLEDVPRVSDALPDVPPDLDELIRRMVQKDPAERPRDAAELLAMLEGLDETTSEVSQPHPSLTRSEQRTLGVVLVPPSAESESVDLAGLRTMMEKRGARLESLADGSILTVLARKAVASDLAAQAAQCALAPRDALPGRPLALTTGRAQIGLLLAGEAIDRAAVLLADDARADVTEGEARIVVDDVTAGLLGARFEVRDAGGKLELVSELDVDEEPRTLLGKSTPCVGREREIGSLEATFAECVEEPVARVVLVTAAAGAGKSRLRNEAVARLRRSSHAASESRSSVEIWTGRGDPMKAGSPFSLIAQMLRRACDIADGEPLETRQRKLRTRVLRHVPEADRKRVTEFLGELIGAPFADRDSVQLRAARQDPMLMSDQVRSAWEDFLGAECGAGPVVLILEDLHWGDLPTVKLVDAALRHLRNKPLMVLALARPEVHDLFPKLWVDREVQEIRLGGLTKKASERLVRQVLGTDVAEPTVAKIVEQADGNAFYLEELIRAVADGRGDALPDTVVAMVETRLEKLDPEARRILRAGSVFGQTFWKGSAAALLGGQTKVAEWLAELTDQELVSKRSAARFSGEDEYVFRHALLRDGAYAMLTDEDRTLGHVLAGDWLEKQGESDAMTLAEHFERGGAKDRARPWYPRATEQALEGNDLEGALARAERGIACGAAGPELGLLRSLQAEAHNWRGENAEAFTLASQAMDLLPKGEATWYAAAREAIITAHKVGSPDRVLEIVEAVGREEGGETTQAARGLAMGWGATMLLYAGKYSQVEEILNDVERGKPTGAAADPRVDAVLHRAKAIWAFVKGKPEAPQWLEAAVEGFERSGDLRNASITRTDLGFVLTEFGAYQDAERLFRQSLVEAERMGLQTSVPQVKHNLGFALLGLGKLDEAATAEIEAAEALHAQGQRRVEGLAKTYLGRILLRKGDLDGAEEAARQAVELLDVAPGSRAVALAVLARTLLAKKNQAEALESAKGAMEILRSLGGLEEGETLVRLTLAEALHETGDPESRTIIAEAKSALLARAKNISGEAFRKSFLERVEENAETLALAAEWLEPRPAGGP